eukprot:1391714-Amorphochlora_amoeboformis.AAC.1
MKEKRKEKRKENAFLKHVPQQRTLPLYLIGHVSLLALGEKGRGMNEREKPRRGEPRVSKRCEGRRSRSQAQDGHTWSLENALKMPPPRVNTPLFSHISIYIIDVEYV